MPPKLRRTTAVSKNNSRRISRFRQLAIEPLEDRRLLAVFTVSNLNDAPVAAAGAAPGTLRQAIFDANAAAGDDMIVFAPALTSGGAATINLGSAGQLVINSNVSIMGPGSSLMTIKAFDSTPLVKDGLGTRVFDVQATAGGPTVTMQGLTLVGGDVQGDGGAIRSAGQLTIDHCVIAGNAATSAGRAAGGGIAILAAGTAQITDSAISGNTAKGNTEAAGGGISNAGYLSLVRSIVTGNKADSQSNAHGGGIAAAAQLVIAESQILMNDASINGQTSSGNSNAGGIDSLAGLIISDSTVSNNRAAQTGGGIAASIMATISYSTISGNSAAFGGGIYGRASGGQNTSLFVTICNINDNIGDGIRNTGTLSLASSTVARNSTSGVTHSGQLVLANGMIDGNFTGVAITTSTGKTADIFNTVVRNNIGGGGINHVNLGGPTDLLTITNCTVSGNSGAAWGGISSTGGLAIVSSTVNDNTGTAVSVTGTTSITSSTITRNVGVNGGGVAINLDPGESAKISHSTITSNRAGSAGAGIYVISGTNVTLDHSIVALNTLISQARRDITGALTATYSLIGDDTGASINNAAGNIIGHAATPIDPQLGPLSNNGGPTMTQVPLVGSIVIDAGNAAAVAGSNGIPMVDQRGAPFARIVDGKAPVGARIDIGAVEWQPHAVPALVGDFNLDKRVDAADYTLWRDTLGAMVEPYGGADADGNGKIETADYQLWKSHFGQSNSSVGDGDGGGSVSISSLAGTVEQEDASSAPQSSAASLPVAPVDVVILAKSPTARFGHEVRRRSSFEAQLTADRGLAAWLAARRVTHVGSPVEESIDATSDVPASADKCDVARAADAVFQMLGTSL